MKTSRLIKVAATEPVPRTLLSFFSLKFSTKLWFMILFSITYHHLHLAARKNVQFSSSKSRWYLLEVDLNKSPKISHYCLFKKETITHFDSSKFEAPGTESPASCLHWEGRCFFFWCPCHCLGYVDFSYWLSSGRVPSESNRLQWHVDIRKWWPIVGIDCNAGSPIRITPARDVNLWGVRRL